MLHKVPLPGTNRVVVWLESPPVEDETQKTPTQKALDKIIVSMIVTKADIAWSKKNREHK